MTQTAFFGPLEILLPPHNAAAPAYTSLLVDANGEKAAVLFRIPRTGNIDKVEFKVGTISINAASTVRVSLQNIDTATGDADGTQDQYRDIAGSAFATGTWMVPGLMTDDGTNGGNKRAVTRGDRVAFVLEYQSFTAADTVNVAYMAVAGSNYGNPPYLSLNTAGSWVKTTGTPAIALKYDDGTYEYVEGCWPASALNTPSSYSSATVAGSGGDERGLRFQIPVPATITGVRIRTTTPTAADYDVVLYDASGNAISNGTTSVEGFESAGTTGRVSTVYFPAEIALSANTTYFILVKPGATALILYEFDVASTDIMRAVPGGAQWYYAFRTDGGTIDVTNTTKRPWISPIFSQFGSDAGGGGVILIEDDE